MNNSKLKNNTEIAQRSYRILEYDKVILRLSALAQSVYGKEICEQLQPTSDLKIAQQRQAETAELLAYRERSGPLPISGLEDIRDAFGALSVNATLEQKTLLRIARFLSGVGRLSTCLDGFDGFIIMRERVDKLMPLSDIRKAIEFCFVSDEEFNDRASAALFQIRQKIRKRQAAIREQLETIISKKGTYLQDPLITLRFDRFVVPVKATNKQAIPGIVHDVSASGQTLFVEPTAVVEMNNQIRQLQIEEKEEMERILRELSASLSDKLSELKQNTSRVGELDFFHAKAHFSDDLRAICPNLNDQGHISFLAARHPLIEDEYVVPIDFTLGEAYRTLVITGPNTGGKTVSLKTCGLLTLMASSGLHLPCAPGSCAAVFDNVLADIGDEQSIEQSLSTFSSHMKNIVEILKIADARSLVLLDELGSGTDPSEGAALAIALLDAIRQSGALLAATTHYKELKAYAAETPEVQNACCEFDIKTLSPTYRLLIGMPGVSNAFSISRRLGLSDDIIDRAKSFLSTDTIRFESLLSSAEQSHRESQKMKEKSQRLLVDIAKKRSELDDEIATFSAKREVWQSKANDARRRLIEEAIDELDTALSQVREQVKEEDLKAKEEKLLALRRSLRGELANTASEDADKDDGDCPDVLVQGQRYAVANLGISGNLVMGPDAKGDYVLEADNMRFLVKRSELRKVREEKKMPQKSPVKSKKMPEPKPMVAEIILLGKRVDEALQEVDLYLDSCVRTGLDHVRIVHGKGTGALRDAIRTFLRTDSRVASFRSGRAGEGDDGVTIANL